MAKKGAGKKAKPQYNPFRRIAQYTVTATSGKDNGDDDDDNNANAMAAVRATPLNSTSPTAMMTADGDEAAAALVDLTDTSVTFTPALPRAEVQLRVQFRCSVALTRGDTITLHLPGFMAPARAFALEAVANVEGVHFASHFYAYWSGTDKMSKSSSSNSNNNNGSNSNNNNNNSNSSYYLSPAAAAAAAYGKPGKNGVPPRQVLLLYCVAGIDAHTLVTVATPRALRLCCPDKLPANSSRLKVEARLARAPGSGKLSKQPVHACSEVRKCTVADELDGYDELLRETVASAGLSRDERLLVTEALSREEVDQVYEGATRRQAYPVPALPWHTALPLFRAYEDAGGFVQMILSNALATVKARDALALHREVADNWGVKVAAVVVVEDVLAMCYAGMYRGLTRRALLACRLLTMEPADVGRMFGLTQLPRQSIVRELDSAYRAYHLARGTYNSNDNSNSSNNSGDNANSNKKSDGSADGDEGDDEDGGGDAAALARCEAILRKWSVLLSTLLTAQLEVDETATDAVSEAGARAATAAGTARASAAHSGNAVASSGSGGGVGARHDSDKARVAEEDTPPLPTHSARAGGSSPAAGGAAGGGGKAHTVRFTVPPDNSSAGGVNSNNSSSGASGGGGDHVMARAVLRPPPPLYVGVRDVAADELQRMRELAPQSWFVFPHVLLARQSCAFLVGQDGRLGSGEHAQRTSHTPTTTATTTTATTTAATRDDGAASLPGTAAAAAPPAEALATSSSAAAMYVPDNSVLFELRWPVEAVELADVSAYPYNREWLLPFSTSCRVVDVRVREGVNELTHVVLEVVGSLVGAVADYAIPDGDRAVAALLVRKLRVEAEAGDAKTTALAQLLYLTVQRNERRLLHPPTLLRAQYVAQFAAVQRASAARTAVEEGAVVWQVSTHAAQMLEEGVVRPAMWEAVPRKYAVLLEQYFCSRCVAHMQFEEMSAAAAAAAEKGGSSSDKKKAAKRQSTAAGGAVGGKKGSVAAGGGNSKDGGGGGGLVVNFVTYTADYAGKGPRPVRRLVERRVTHEPPVVAAVAAGALWDDLQERLATTGQQLAALNAKLGITATATATTTTSSAQDNGGSSKPAARTSKKSQG